jgi:hypothetical protein
MAKPPDTKTNRSLAETLRDRLIHIFPDFVDHCPLDQLRDEMNPAPLHFVMRCFTEHFGARAALSSQKQLKDLGALVNDAVANHDDVIENAVSTCFLEHLQQVRGYKPLVPFLSTTAKRKTRP